MAELLDPATFTGPHPTHRDLVDQLRAWGFTQRRTDGVHLVFRGPHGGTVRVLRSLLGRADADTAAKAARLARVDLEKFWHGPDTDAGRADELRPDTAEPAEPQPASPRSASPSSTCADPASSESASAVELFERMFPEGVQMTAEMFADFEQWTRLTTRLAAATTAPGPRPRHHD